MIKLLKELFRNVPSDYFKLSMKEYAAIHNYEADGTLYEVFENPNTKLQLIVEVDTSKIVGMQYGRRNF